MTERSCEVLAVTVGGALGALAGYMLFTERGRLMRRQLEPALEDTARELVHLRNTMQRIASMATESWGWLHEALGEASTSSPRYADPHQTTPF